MIRELSILIPAYDTCCLRLVQELARQCAATDGLRWEIVVADDGSEDPSTVAANRPIGDMPHCQYAVREQNVGRAAIRNWLARHASYGYLLFIDADMTVCSDEYVARYLRAEGEVVYGGYVIAKDRPAARDKLRYIYEKASEETHTCAARQRHPDKDFHTSNFLVRKELLERFPFDERFRHYGYEDVLWGKVLTGHGLQIAHTDNPLVFDGFEDNAHFVAKTEEALTTLHHFATELDGYSTLLSTATTISRWHLSAVVRLWHHLFGNVEKRNLHGSRPSLLVFKLYKLGFFMSIQSPRSASGA